MFASFRQPFTFLGYKFINKILRKIVGYQRHSEFDFGRITFGHTFDDNSNCQNVVFFTKLTGLF